MKKRWAILMLSVLVLATAVTIFYFSAQSASLSSVTSRRVTRWLLGVFRPGFHGLTGQEQQALIARYSAWVRKGAHFMEFCLLAFFLRLLLQWLRVKWKTCWAWGLAALYAVTDELHQMAVSGRAAMARDVMIDSAGALLGALLALLLCFLSGRRKRKRGKGA